MVTCPKCSGSGIYRWGAIVNGVHSFSGECFRCHGTGRVAERASKLDAALVVGAEFDLSSGSTGRIDKVDAGYVVIDWTVRTPKLQVVKTRLSRSVAVRNIREGIWSFR